jgi:predicted nucleic acid-binding protein
MVLDTSVWIEMLIGSPLGRQLNGMRPPLDEIVMPTMVLLELTKWTYREGGDEAVNRIVAIATETVMAPLSSEIAVRAGECHWRHQLATADAAIYATARTYNTGLLTCDAHFQGLDSVTYVPKVVS